MNFEKIIPDRMNERHRKELKIEFDESRHNRVRFMCMSDIDLCQRLSMVICYALQSS